MRNPFSAVRHQSPAAGDDPLAAAGRRIALIVAGNQPLYPLYLHWFVGAGALAACGTWLSTPAFLAAALLARRHSRGSRVLLPLAGMANTVWSAKLLGASAGLTLFLIPCLLIALLILRRGEWPLLMVLIVLGILSLWAMPLVGAVPLAQLSAAQKASLWRLNGWSVVSLTLFAGWSLGRARFSGFSCRRAHARSSTPSGK